MPSDVTWISVPNISECEIARSFDDFVKTIESYGMPVYVSFDHDLADEHYVAMLQGSNDYGEEKTGYDCAKWLVDFCADREIPFPDFGVHSLNPVGSENIRQYITSAKKHLNI
jgi:hypothetical protein